LYVMRAVIRNHGGYAINLKMFKEYEEDFFKLLANYKKNYKFHKRKLFCTFSIAHII
jgi:hypothetical protein